MDVRVKIRLTILPTDKHKAEMFKAATALTNNRRSIMVFILPDEPESIIAQFSIKNARQSDVVDKIGKAFSHTMYDYSDATIVFPKRK